jgi:small subunit ribosomal protein S1
MRGHAVTFAEPNDQNHPVSADNPAVESQQPATTSEPSSESAGRDSTPSESAAEIARRRILIGSQRDPVAYRARQRRDWTPIEEQKSGKKQVEGGKPKPVEKAPKAEVEKTPPSPTTVCQSPVEPSPVAQAEPVVPKTQADVPQEAKFFSSDSLAASSSFDSAASAVAKKPEEAKAEKATPEAAAKSSSGRGPKPFVPPAAPRAVPLPNLRDKLSPELEDELNQAMGDGSFDELMGFDAAKSNEVALEPESLQSGRVVAVRRDDVFVELGRREQGIVSLRQFDVPPTPGTVVQVVVQRFNPEDGLYELSVPNKAIQVDDWSDLIEGKLIEIHVTGHNAGGLECEVNHIRGFIPVSQIALYRVEDLAQFVDQRMTCIITEANPDRRNLVLSRRAVLEREREQTRQQMLTSLQPGQVLDGVVRKLMDFGAFVDIGGVDGLLHISQLAWGRVKHPSDVLQEGQKIRVRVEKIDPETGKISLAYRDLLESPWQEVAKKYPTNSPARGTVTKLMDFGAFVELEPGVEGLVHISELSHKRIWRASDVVHEGDQVDVLVLSVDTAAQRISLSMKAMSSPPEPVKKEEEVAEAAPVKASNKTKRTGPLLGGISRPSGGDRFGLKW